MGLTDFLISFSIIMMMLSFVSERASNFIKLYFQNKTIYIPFIYRNDKKFKFFLTAKLTILAYKQPTEGGEKEREYRLMIINIIIGIIIAALANANFFEIVKKISSSATNKDVVIVQGWLMDDINYIKVVGFFYLLLFVWSMSLLLFNKLQENTTTVNSYYVRTPFLLWIIVTIVFLLLGNGDKNSNYLIVINHTIGYIFVGVFLSLGSKFWHDLLDLLFKFKNTQQVLSDPKTYTNYGSTDQLMALAETSQYQVAEELYELYVEKIKKINGVVSYGLHTILDTRSNLFRKVIEVEYTSASAQNELLELQNSGSKVINFNTFYLKDYMNVLFTQSLKVVTSIDSSPLCYAYNENSPSSKGSFNVLIKNDRYYAVSNLHVFADSEELVLYSKNSSYNLRQLTVYFNVGGTEYAGTIATNTIKFGDYNDNGLDECFCEISGDLYNAYNAFIDTKKFSNFDSDVMALFGATSKYMTLPKIKSFAKTTCKVDYDGFTKELRLIKIDCKNRQNVNYGDSGSFVYYKLQEEQNKYTVYNGVIVAKSDNYAYMFRFTNY